MFFVPLWLVRSQETVETTPIIGLQEWLKWEDLTYPAMRMPSAEPNYFTIDGEACPSTCIMWMEVGEMLRFRFISTNTGSIHRMHIHGGPEDAR